MKYGMRRRLLPLHSRSREGAWIEIALLISMPKGARVAPVRERGLKFFGFAFQRPLSHVAPVRERGLKSSRLVYDKWVNRRSREGAWIEMAPVTLSASLPQVAPVRERGLK